MFSNIFSLTHWLFKSILFNLEKFSFVINFSFIPLWTKKHAIRFQSFEIYWDLFYGLTSGWSWRMFRVHLRRICVLLSLGGVLYICLLEIVGVQWLILWVKLTGLREAHIASKTFLSMSVIVFLEKLKFESVHWIKTFHSCQCGWALSNLLKTQIEEKVVGRVNSVCILCWDPTFSYPQTLECLAFQSLRQPWSGRNTTGRLTFQDLGLMQRHSLGFPASTAQRCHIMEFYGFHSYLSQFPWWTSIPVWIAVVFVLLLLRRFWLTHMNHYSFPTLCFHIRHLFCHFICYW